jgi:hypothetical protein
MSTTIQYNGIELHNVSTKDWRQEIIYDASHTDKLYNKITIKVEGICHNQIPFTALSPGQRIISVDPGNNPSDLQGMHNLIISQLGVPRGNFKMFLESANGIPEIVILEATGGIGNTPTVDVDNGPKPSNITISEIVSNKIYKVGFTIEVAVTFCNIDRYSPFVLNNRWSIGEAMDDNFFITRTIHGRLRMAYSSMNSGATVPGHAVKYLVMPPLEWGFRRDSINYISSENQYECEYTIIDKQVHKAAPWPATKMEITHSTGTSDGFTARAECNVRLEGPPWAQSILLMIRAIQVINLVLGIEDLEQAKDYLVEDANFTNHIGEKPVIEASKRISTILKFKNSTEPSSIMTKLIMSCGDGEFTDAAGNMLLKPIPGYEGFIYDEGKSPIPHTYGYDPKGGVRSPVNLFIQHCYLQTPCSPAKGIDQANVQLDAGASGTSGTLPKVEGYQYPSATLPEQTPSKYSAATQEALYTYCAQENKYSDDSLKLQLPLAGNASSSDPTQDTSKIIQLGPKQAQLEITCHFERVGKLPEIPAPDEEFSMGPVLGVDCTLLKKWESVFPPQLTNDGTKSIYRIDAHYVYALSRPISKDEYLWMGALPYVQYEVDNDAVKDGLVKREILYSQPNGLTVKVPPL